MSLRESVSYFGESLRRRWLYRRGFSLPRFLRMESRGSGRGSGRSGKSRIVRLAFFGIFLLVAYYVVGAFWIHNIDDDPDFMSSVQDTGGARAVALAAALIEREVVVRRWTPNDPFFIPGVLLDNMPNYQQGIMAALARFSFELTDQLGRTRGSSQADRDLQDVSGLLQYPGDVWVWNPSVSLAPRATAESQYREARRALLSYNARLVRGDAVFERRADNLLATLDRMALDIGSSSAALDQAVVQDSGAFIDNDADNHFYYVKGQLYAYSLILEALGQDFETLISERELTSAWQQMLDSFRKAALLQPWVVSNAAPDAQFFPNHLAAQGFYLLRARTQLREITNILLK